MSPCIISQGANGPSLEYLNANLKILEDMLQIYTNTPIQTGLLLSKQALWLCVPTVESTAIRQHNTSCAGRF